MTLLFGLRAASLSNRERKELRAIGHAMEPSVLVGRAGLSDELVGAAEAALLRHGIVKVKLTKGVEADKEQALDDLAWATGALTIHRVGKTAVLRRPDVRLDPPVKRGGKR